MPQEPAADLVLRGAAVTTVDPVRPTADAVAVRGGRIVAVGSDADVAGLVGARTRVVEGRGRTVLPGFQDAHVHPPEAGLDALQCDVREPAGELPLGPAALVDRIGAYAAAHPDAPWILGSGWYMGAFPERDAAPSRPRRRRWWATGVPAQSRRSQRLGQQPRARAGRDRSRDARSAARSHRARPRRDAERGPARGGDGPR